MSFIGVIIEGPNKNRLDYEKSAPGSENGSVI